MGNHEGKLLFLHPDVQYLVLHVHSRELVQRAQGLVQKQYLRLVDEGAHQRHALRHAAGKLGRVIVTKLRQAGYFEHMLNFFGLALIVAPQIEAEGNILLRSQPREKRRILEYQPSAGGGAAYLLAVDRNAAQGGRDKPRHKAQYSGFSAAGGPHQRNKFPAGHLYAHILKRMGDLIALHLCEYLADVFKLEANRLFFV